MLSSCINGVTMVIGRRQSQVKMFTAGLITISWLRENEGSISWQIGISNFFCFSFQVALHPRRHPLPRSYVYEQLVLCSGRYGHCRYHLQVHRVPRVSTYSNLIQRVCQRCQGPIKSISTVCNLHSIDSPYFWQAESGFPLLGPFHCGR